jgi:erythromycin esterase-like protein
MFENARIIENKSEENGKAFIWAHNEHIIPRKLEIITIYFR